jgi:hypothetical protein
MEEETKVINKNMTDIYKWGFHEEIEDEEDPLRDFNATKNEDDNEEKEPKSDKKDKIIDHFKFDKLYQLHINSLFLKSKE